MANQASTAPAWCGQCHSFCFCLSVPGGFLVAYFSTWDVCSLLSSQLVILAILDTVFSRFLRQQAVQLVILAILDTVFSRFLRQQAVALECGTLLFRNFLSSQCFSSWVNVLLSRSYLLVTQELLDCNDVTSPDVHLGSPRGPEVVWLHLLIKHPVHLLYHCIDECILVSIVEEQFKVVFKLFVFLFL